MSTFDIIFWLLIVLIAVLAYTIESGLSARHRNLVLSSIMSATLAAVYMMFIVDDSSEFGSGPAHQRKKEKAKVTMGAGNGDGKLPEVEVTKEPDAAFLETISRYKDGPLLKKSGGFRDCPDCPLMTLVPAGSFIIGSPREEAGRDPNEGPQKAVRFTRPFTVSRYEINYREFAAFVTATSYHATRQCLIDGKVASGADWQKPGIEQPTPDHPVVCLSWVDANAYAKWLTEKTKRKYSLPSEPEWEYVARAGTKSQYWTGDKITKEQANFAGLLKGTSKGGKFDYNGFKVYDTAGNVWEMTDDCWINSLVRVSPSGFSVREEGDCKRSAVRGGAWNSTVGELRSAIRRPLAHNLGSNTVGIRLVREIK